MANDVNVDIYTEQGGSNRVVESGAKDGKIGGASFTIGAEAADAITVNVQLEKADSNASPIEFSGVVDMFLSDSSDGLDLSTTAPSGGVAAGTDGDILVEFTSDLIWKAQSENDGDIDVAITNTTAGTWYLVVCLPDGSQSVSDAITFS